MYIEAKIAVQLRFKRILKDTLSSSVPDLRFSQACSISSLIATNDHESLIFTLMFLQEQTPSGWLTWHNGWQYDNVP